MFSVTSNSVGSAYGQIYWIHVLQPITVRSVTLFDIPQLYFLNNATYLPWLLLLTGFSYRHIGLASQPPLFIAANSPFCYHLGLYNWLACAPPPQDQNFITAVYVSLGSLAMPFMLCSGLDENGHHRFKCLNSWGPQWVSLFGKV